MSGTNNAANYVPVQYNAITGGASGAINNVAPSATSGVPLISQGSSSQPAFGTALVAGGGTAATSFNTNGVVVTGSTSTTALSSLSLTSGQLVIGGTSSPAAATLTAGAGVSITNGNNSITIASTGGAFTWTNVTSTPQALAAQNGYVANDASEITFTLPTNSALGDTIRIMGKGAGGWTITYTTSQFIQFGNVATTTTSGALSSSNQFDCVTIVCTTASATAPVFSVEHSIGNLTVA